MKSAWDDFIDDLPFEPSIKTKERAVITPASIRFFKVDTDAIPARRVTSMNEITIAATAMRAAADALLALSKKMDLQAFDEPPVSAPLIISVKALQMLAADIASQHGAQAVKAVIADEANGKKISDMSDFERELCRIAFDLLAAQGVK